MGVEDGIWVWRMVDGCGGWYMGVEDGIWVWRMVDGCGGW